MLHLFLRVSDILIQNIISSAVTQDCHVIKSTETSLLLLVDKIRSCGITFNVRKILKILNISISCEQVWKQKEKKDCYDWTSLRGTDRKILFQKFPKFIPEIIHGEQGTIIQELWEVQK